MGSDTTIIVPVLTRRQLMLGSAAAGAALTWSSFGGTVVANQAGLADLGLPTIDITVNPDSFDGVPDTLEAGRYLLNVSASGPATEMERDAIIGFIRPNGVSIEEFMSVLGPPPGAVGASPAAEDAEDGGDAGGGAPPSFVYQATFAGGAAVSTSSAPGSTASAVIDLTEGEWIAWGDDPEAPQTPVVFTVTGAFPAGAAEPEADIMVTLVDFGIMVEGNLTAGDHILRIENLGAQPHFVEIEMVPDGTTNDDLTALLDSFITGTPVAGGLTDADFQPVGYTPVQSIGTVTWHLMSLDAGTYDAVCFFPTAGIGDPHAFHGMHTVFVVS